MVVFSPVSLFLMCSLLLPLKNSLEQPLPKLCPKAEDLLCLLWTHLLFDRRALCTLIQKKKKTHTDKFVRLDLKPKCYGLFQCLHDSNTSSWLELSISVTFMVLMEGLGVSPFPRKGNLWCRVALHSPKKKIISCRAPVRAKKTLWCDTSPLCLHR